MYVPLVKAAQKTCRCFKIQFLQALKMDDFCHANCPLAEDFPTFTFELSGLQISRSLNCATALPDASSEERGWGARCDEDRVRHDVVVSQITRSSNWIVNMLVHDAGLVTSNMVLLDGTNHLLHIPLQCPARLCETAHHAPAI